MEVNLKLIEGNWDLGYALDKHTLSSEIIGQNAQGYPIWDTVRSEVGQAMFLLKYRDDKAQAPALAAEIVKSIYPKFDNVGLVIPMPASKARAWQPVGVLADHIGNLVGRNVFHNILSKKVTGQSVKDIGGKADRAAALGKLRTSCPSAGNGRLRDAEKPDFQPLTIG